MRKGAVYASETLSNCLVCWSCKHANGLSRSPCGAQTPKQFQLCSQTWWKNDVYLMCSTVFLLEIIGFIVTITAGHRCIESRCKLISGLSSLIWLLISPDWLIQTFSSPINALWNRPNESVELHSAGFLLGCIYRLVKSTMQINVNYI